MKYKWPVTAIKPLKNKLFSVTSNPSTLVYFMSTMIQFHSWLNLLTAARLKVPFSKNFLFSYLKLYLIKITCAQKFCDLNKSRFFVFTIF